MIHDWKCRVMFAIGSMLIATCGCYSPRVYAPRPLTNCQPIANHWPINAASVRGDEADSLVASTDSGVTEIETLTPARAAEIAVLDHPALRTLRADRGIANAQIIQAGILPNPQLSASFDSPVFGSTVGTTTGDAESISWDVSKLRPLDAKIRSARANASAVDMDIVWQEWQFAQAARQSVYDLAALNSQLDALQFSQETLEENLKLVEEAVDEGNLTLIELSAAQSAAIAARTNTLVVQQEINQQRVLVNRALGRPTDSLVEIAADIQFPDEFVLPQFEELLATAESRPDIEAIGSKYQSQEHALRAAVDGQIPTTNISLTRASDTGSVGTLGAGITIDLQWFDQNQGAIAAECALREKIREQYEQQIFTARSEVDSALTDFRSLQEQVKTVQEAIPVFQKLVDTYEKAVKEKNANVLVYYLAFNDLTQRQVDIWKLRRQLMDAKITLETSVGLPLN